MVFNRISTVLAFLFFVMQAHAQNTGIKGVVIDASTGEALIGATIKINEIGTVSNYDGTYNLDMESGQYSVVFSHIGYMDKIVVADINEGQILEINESLSVTTNMLETATITGSKHEKSLAHSAVSINVIKPSLLENTNAVSVTSALDKVPGVQLIDNQANIRGGSGWSYGAGSRVLLLIDDIPALQGDAGRPSWGDIPVENISQIEVLKGASSTLYGSSAMNGIINIRTGYATSEPETKASISYVHFMSPKDSRKQWWDTAPNRINLGLTHKQKFGDLDVVANGFYDNYDGYYEGQFENRFRFAANLKYRISDRITAGVNAMFNKGETANPFIWADGGPGAYQGLAGSIIATNNTRYYVDPQVTIFDKKDNRHKIHGRYYYINNKNSSNQSNSSNSSYLEYQFLKSFKKIDLNFTAGTSAYFVNSNSELFGDVKLTSNNLAVFAEGDKKFGDKVRVTVGLRHEHNYQGSPEVFKGDTIPGGLVEESKIIARAGLNYELGKATFVRASWGQGYRFPTITERFIETAVSGFFIFPNVFLGSERGWTTEIGIKQGLQIGSWQGLIDVATFWSQYDDMTEFTFLNIDGKQGFQSQNVGATDIKGFEVNVIGNSTLFEIPINIIAGYTYINPTYRDFDTNEGIQTSISTPVGATEKQNILKYRNKHNFKIDIESTVSNFTLGVAANYTSQTLTIDQLLNNIGFIEFYRKANPNGFLKVDSRLSYQFKSLKISILAKNILNEEYTLRPGLLEAPRNIGMRLDVKL